MNKNLKIMITYGVVGAIGFWGGIKLYEYFNKDTKPTQTETQISEENTKQVFSSETYQGMYSYMADANNFRLCKTGENHPVAMVENYLELEKNYLALSPNGKEVYVELGGYLDEVKAMEGKGNVTAFIVQNIIKIDKNKMCN